MKMEKYNVDPYRIFDSYLIGLKLIKDTGFANCQHVPCYRTSS